MMGILGTIESFENKVALISPERGAFTYSDVIKNTCLLKKHVQEKSFILLVCTNSIETFLSYIFALRNNCTVMLIDEKTKAKDINTLITAYNHDVIIAPSDILHPLENRNTESINNFFDYGIMKLGQVRKKPL